MFKKKSEDLHPRFTHKVSLQNWEGNLILHNSVDLSD